MASAGAPARPGARPGGAVYQAGDRVVTLAPGEGGRFVTSETGTVVTVDAKARTLTVRRDNDGDIRILDEREIAADRLAHGYAVTVHRSQGSTVERAHALEDGGGRELAYVKMGRAKDRSTVYVVADSMEQAVEDLRREWSAERRPAWAIDSGTPVTNARAVEGQNRVALPMRSALPGPAWSPRWLPSPPSCRPTPQRSLAPPRGRVAG